MKKTFRTQVAVVALLIGGAVWHASRSTCPGPAVGTSVNGSVVAPRQDAPLSEEQRAKSCCFVQEKSRQNAQRIPAAKAKGPFDVCRATTKNGEGVKRRPTLRLGAFNIHGGKGSDGRRDLDRVAQCLQDLDFVALNEVRGYAAFDNWDQAEQLADRLGTQWLFAPANRQWYCREFGNGLLTRLPVACWERIPLPRQFDRTYRNMVLVDLPIRAAKNEARTIHVLITHLNQRYDAERQMQLQAAIVLYLSLAEPAVLMGDLNSRADDPQIQRLLGTPGVSDAVGTKLGERASGLVDWIVVRGLRCVDAGIRDNGVSDHPLVWAELELPR